jgi:hypothetical protein
MRKKLLFVVVVIVIIAGLVGWFMGRSNKSTNQTGTTAQNQPSKSSASARSLVSYTLPDGWSENSCSGATLYIIPNGSALDCSANPSAPVKLFLDAGNTTDCDQLKPADNTGIRKHVCISLYIDGHKTLKASTEFAKSASYKTDTTIADYYMNTGKGVVALEYTYTSTNNFQVGFDQFAKSLVVK